MPTTYTHHRFGNDVFSRLPAPLQEKISPYRALFDIGLHGPDFLFYYKPLSKNPVNQLGHRMHDQPGKTFFMQAVPTLTHMDQSDAGFAYICGFLCHFALDSTCHPYIEQQVRATGVTHSEIESELDRLYMIQDGLDPIRHKPANHLTASDFQADVIQTFFPAVSKQEIFQALKGIRRYCNFLVAPSRLKRKLIFAGLKIAGCYDFIHGMIVNYQPNPICVPVCQTLEQLYESAIPKALSMIGTYPDVVAGKAVLDACFDHTFGEN